MEGTSVEKNAESRKVTEEDCQCQRERSIIEQKLDENTSTTSGSDAQTS